MAFMEGMFSVIPAEGDIVFSVCFLIILTLAMMITNWSIWREHLMRKSAGEARWWWRGVMDVPI